MTDFNKIIIEIIDEMRRIHYDSGDMSDIGNHVGIAIAKHFKEDELGSMTKSNFITGLDHGVSLIDGSHG